MLQCARAAIRLPLFMTFSHPFAILPMNYLDIAALDELHAMLGEDLHEITRHFVAQLDEQVTTMQAAWQQRDASVLQTVAHTLKGSAANLGAVGVASLAAEIMMAARQNRLDAIATPLAQLPEACRATVAQMRAGGYAPG